MENKIITYLKKLKSILDEGKNKGLNFKEALDKITDAITSINNDEINIVLFGSFSDGKTSVVAGWLEEEFANMKIDSDESSDEIIIYKPNNINARIIDTPGLFGDKELGKEKLSDLTIKYISEAHLVIYVVDAVNPMKDSHKGIIKWLLKDIEKLEQTVFVINKMDTVADIEDIADFSRNSKIKINTFLNSISNLLVLSTKEKDSINIKCVSANPYNEGLESWFREIEEYRRLSHLSALKNEVDKVLTKNSSLFIQKTAISVVLDIVQNQSTKLENNIKASKYLLENRDNQIKKIKEDLEHIKKDAGNTLSNIKAELDALRQSIIQEISSSSAQNFYDIIDIHLGIKGKGKNQEIGFALQSKIQDIVDSGVNNLNGETLKIINSIDEKVIDLDDTLQKFMLGGLGKFIKSAKSIPVKKLRNGILAARDGLKISKKFKPWGAIKLAKKLGHGMAVASAIFDIAIALWDKKKQSEFVSIKKDMNASISSVFSEIIDSLGTTDDFIETYIKGYKELINIYANLKITNSNISDTIDTAVKWKSKLDEFINNTEIEDINFEIVNDN